MDVSAAEELLRNNCGVTARAIWQIAGTLILIAGAILLISGYKKAQHSIVGGFCLEKKGSVLRKLNFCPEKIHSWTKNYVSLNLLSILLWIIIRKSVLSFLKQI